ncbi:MAG: hypothetical protein P8H03_09925, partial [Emcibacteraceae bacterium]|nr:hypothetical protein [Emcibacteraceae bacterium]
AEGENRALDAAEAAISNPLLDEVSMQGAQGVLINITGGMDLTLFEVDEAANRIRGEVDPEANILVGSALDSSLDGKMRVSVVATGIEADSMPKAELPQKIYSKTKVDTPVIEETVHETSEPLAEVVEEPLDLTNEVEDELEELVDRLQKEKTSEEQALKGFVTEHTADDRDAPFIAPEAAIPEVTVEELAAEPEMVREPIIETVVEEAPRETPRQKLGLFQNLLGSKKEPAVQKEPILKNTASMQQGDMLDFGSTSELELADEKEQSKPELIISKEPVVEKTAEEDHLEIPAFLRRQAN